MAEQTKEFSVAKELGRLYMERQRAIEIDDSTLKGSFTKEFVIFGCSVLALDIPDFAGDPIDIAEAAEDQYVKIFPKLYEMNLIMPEPKKG